jgi:hypothetical protein
MLRVTFDCDGMEQLELNDGLLSITEVMACEGCANLLTKDGSRERFQGRCLCGLRDTLITLSANRGYRWSLSIPDVA